MDIPTRTLMRLRHLRNGSRLMARRQSRPRRKDTAMVYSFTQISNYLRCPRSYRHRYLDGWRERETRAAMIFGRCFEKALESVFKGNDCGPTLFREWSAFR